MAGDPQSYEMEVTRVPTDRIGRPRAAPVISANSAGCQCRSAEYVVALLVVR